jgi:putative hydrolase of the HAD superfamily
VPDLPHAVNAVLFDLDNTLADRDEGFVRWARWFAVERLGCETPPEIESAVASLIVRDAGGYTPRDAFMRALQEQYAYLADDTETLIAAFRSQLVAHLPPLDEGAVAFLTALDEARMPWGIVTNGSSRSQLGKIHKLGLADRARCLVISEDIGIRKPDPEIFLLAAARLGVAASDALFVGDHPEIDMTGAANAGMRTAWLHRGRRWPSHLTAVAPDFVIDSLQELMWAADHLPPSSTPRR